MECYSYNIRLRETFLALLEIKLRKQIKYSRRLIDSKNLNLIYILLV